MSLLLSFDAVLLVGCGSVDWGIGKLRRKTRLEVGLYGSRQGGVRERNTRDMVYL